MEAARKTEEIDAGARKSIFMRHLTYARSLLLERRQLGETEREAWGKARKDHIHTEAARLVLRLDRMEAQQRAAFLRSFDAYRKWAKLDAQIEMFPDAGEPSPEAGDMALSTEPAIYEIGPDTPENPPEDGRQACRLGVDATLNPYDPEKEPEAYEEWSDAWTSAYSAGEWQADLQGVPDEADNGT